MRDAVNEYARVAAKYSMIVAPQLNFCEEDDEAGMTRFDLDIPLQSFSFVVVEWKCLSHMFV